MRKEGISPCLKMERSGVEGGQDIILKSGLLKWFNKFTKRLRKKQRFGRCLVFGRTRGRLSLGNSER